MACLNRSLPRDLGHGVMAVVGVQFNVTVHPLDLP